MCDCAARQLRRREGWLNPVHRLDFRSMPLAWCKGYCCYASRAGRGSRRGVRRGQAAEPIESPDCGRAVPFWGGPLALRRRPESPVRLAPPRVRGPPFLACSPQLERRTLVCGTGSTKQVAREDRNAAEVDEWRRLANHGRDRRRLTETPRPQNRGRDRRPRGGARVNALRSARGPAAAPPRVQKCSCDGGGWIVTLDRDRYHAPADAGMLRCTRCVCLDYAPSPAQAGGAGAVLAGRNREAAVA